jgi:hypothetical protein
VASNDGDEWNGIIVGLFVIGGMLIWAFDNSLSNSLWYSYKYRVGFSTVHTDVKPTDCDFLTAPLGIKNCSYKAHARALNADGAWIAGDGAPIYGNDTTTGKPIVSNDAGNSWYWFEGTTLPNLKPDVRQRVLG